MSALERECAVFARYLIDAEPSPAVTEAYVRAHGEGPLVGTGPGSERFQRLLVAVARRGGLATRLADAHARWFAPGGPLRAKLVLTLALLEVDAASFERVDALPARSFAGVAVGTGLRAALFAVLALAGLVVFLPARVVCALLP